MTEIDLVIFDCDGARSKPKPDIFLFDAQRMGVDPSRTIVVEDSVHGVRAAGMRVIGFTGGSHTYPAHTANLTQAGAQAIVARMRDLTITIAGMADAGSPRVDRIGSA